MSNSWLLLSTSGSEYQGNEGYRDLLGEIYCWDSTVKRSSFLKSGDLILLWDGKQLLGSSVIEEIEIFPKRKKYVYRCPFKDCEKAGVKERSTKLPRYRCDKCRREFDERTELEIEVTEYQARYGAEWNVLDGVNAVELRSICEKPKEQHSMRPLNLEALCVLMEEKALLLPSFMTDREDQEIPGGHRLTQTKARNGQAQFAKNLIRKFGFNCAFTGRAPKEVLEACHLYSYANDGRHIDGGGLLMRRDIHRLFDSGLISADPNQDIDGSAKIRVDQNLEGFPQYWSLNGKSITVRLGQREKSFLSAHYKERPSANY
jgi:hypothetical protein